MFFSNRCVASTIFGSILEAGDTIEATVLLPGACRHHAASAAVALLPQPALLGKPYQNLITNPIEILFEPAHPACLRPPAAASFAKIRLWTWLSPSCRSQLCKDTLMDVAGDENRGYSSSKGACRHHRPAWLSPSRHSQLCKDTLRNGAGDRPNK